MQSIITDILGLYNIKKAYMDKYNLSPHQYDMLDDFYENNKSSNGLIKNSLIQQLFKHCIMKRGNEIRLSDNDLTRIINCIDQDKDGFLSFSEFVELLDLGLAKKSNLVTRIQRYLKEEKIDQATGNSSIKFLSSFYSPTPDSLAEVHQQNDSADKIFTLENTLVFGLNSTQHTSALVCNLAKPLEKKDFSKATASYFQHSLFV